MKIVGFKPNIIPKPFQAEGIGFLESSPYAVLGDDMGLGKTLQALGAILNVRPQAALVIVPSYLRGNWENEVEKLTEFKLKTKSKRFTEYYCYETSLIISTYSNLKHIEELFDLADWVVADEAHYLKNVDSIRGGLFHEYIYEKMPRRLTLMTGTPVENRTIEWYSLFKLINYEYDNPRADTFMELFPNQWKFNYHFSNPVKFTVNGRTVTKFKGSRNVQDLKAIQRGRYLRRVAEDVLDLPPISIKDVLINYSFDGNLEEEWDDFVSTNKSNDSSAKALSALAKAPYTAKYVADLHDEVGHPIIVFTDHIESGEAIAAKLECPFISGATPSKKRSEMAVQFQESKYKYLVATIGSFSTGFTLTKAADAVFNDESWVPGRNRQARKRIYRIGQEKKCLIHRIQGSHQDLKISKMLEEKEKETLAVL